MLKKDLARLMQLRICSYCNIQNETLNIKGEKMYVRIAQVNKDGSKSYSKVVQVVKE
ncbi:MAG: hypothetical protein M9959_02695 [Chitinophagaceae bacterium]|nr:hypothetical protein [Chitinophagaceae bacterium]